MSLLDRSLYLKIKSLYETNPRRFKGWRDSTSLGTKFSLTDKVTGEVFKGWHSVGYYGYKDDDFSRKLEFIQKWDGPFFCTPLEVKELYEIVSKRRGDRVRKLWKMKLEKLQNKKLADLKKAYEE